VSAPLVALTTGAVDRAGRHEQPQARIYGAYISALEDAGLTPVLVTPLHSSSAVRSLLENCAGLVLSGGEDVDPARYGEAPIPELDAVSAERDALEWLAIDTALARNLPVFGICRGIQVLNVHMGGTLYQDVPAQRPDAVIHEQPEPWGQDAHEIAISENSLLSRIVRGSCIRVNSFHHQAIKDLAPGLAVSARTEDGLIEGVEASSHPWLVGVQWHPERYPANAPSAHPDRLLFRAFADAVQQFRNK
jgi:putative glutamine amidotransferase